MLALLTFLARKAGWFLLMFLLVLASLTLAPKLWETGKAARDRASLAVEQSARARLAAAALEQRQVAFATDAREQVRFADVEAKGLLKMGRGRIFTAREDLAKRRKDAVSRVLDDGRFLLAFATADSDAIVASVRAEHVDIPLIDRALQLIASRQGQLQGVERQARGVSEYNRGVQAFRKARDGHLRARGHLISRKAGLDRAAGTRSCRMLRMGCPNREAVQRLNDRLGMLKRNAIALERFRSRLIMRERSLAAFRVAATMVADSRAVVANAADAYLAELARTRAQAQSYVANRSRSALQRNGWLALWIVLGAVLSPLLWKLFSFIVIAPFVARALPMRLSAPGQPLAASTSHAALTVAIDRDTELLLRSQAQSAASDLKGDDVCVLSARMFFTCLAAGLVNLQRLTSDRPDHVTVTATGDESFEVALLEVPAGGAVVLHPRALVGIRQRRGTKLRIGRPWRLGSLASWLTFQFRFVVFHGPCALIVQGRRGVQVDYAGPVPGRMINNRLTLGFETSLDYGTARSASFMPYLRGEASLFTDRFSGDGCFIYEQRPSIAGRGFIWGRGIVGMKDAVLKAVGI